jgi:hypothetical protein
VFMPLAASAGGGSRMSVCMSRLKSISMSTARYGADYQDRLASLQGRPGETIRWPTVGLNQTITYPNTRDGNLQSAADHAVDIMIRRGARPDFARINGWNASLLFSQLAISEHDQEPLPSTRWACPEDWILQTWQANPLDFNNLGIPSPVSPGPLFNADKRWPFISSYLRGTYTWSPDRSSSTTEAWYFSGALSAQGQGTFSAATSRFGQRRLTEVAFPAQKVYLWDRGSRHFTPRAVYWNYPETKQPLMYFDGASRTTRTANTRVGWDWIQPNRQNVSFDYTYTIRNYSESWQPGDREWEFPFSRTMTAAHYATTREGLVGRDLGVTGVAP